KIWDSKDANIFTKLSELLGGSPSTYADFLAGVVVLLVFWLILFWMYRRKLFVRILASLAVSRWLGLERARNSQRANPPFLMQYRNFSPRRNSCFPTTTGEASIGSSSRLVASTSSSSACFSTSVVPSRPVT